MLFSLLMFYLLNIEVFEKQNHKTWFSSERIFKDLNQIERIFSNVGFSHKTLNFYKKFFNSEKALTAVKHRNVFNLKLSSKTWQSDFFNHQILKM